MFMEELNEKIKKIDEIVQKIIDLRGNPTLILYYPDDEGTVVDDDVEDIYNELRASGLSPDEKIKELDIILHTTGGHPNPAYAIAQILHDFANKITMLVPKYAYSAGTLLCLGANEIKLGHYATLSPIDITLSENRTSEGGIGLINIDYFMDFARKCRMMCADEDLSTNVETELLVEMVKQVTALDIGKYFRERMMTGHYAQVLLDNYLLAERKDKIEKRKQIINKLLFESPSHDFDIDYHITQEWMMPVGQMTTTESDSTKKLIECLDKLTEDKIICEYVSEGYRMPFFKLYQGSKDNEN